MAALQCGKAAIISPSEATETSEYGNHQTFCHSVADRGLQMCMEGVNSPFKLAILKLLCR